MKTLKLPTGLKIKRIFAYLQGTSNYGLCFNGKEGGSLIGFTDADYARDPASRRSTTGFVFLLNFGPIAWSSRRQNCVALSTTEAEFVAASETAKEAIWQKRMLHEVDPQRVTSVPLLCDNQSTIRLIKNPEFYQRTKHIDERYYFIRDTQEAGDIAVSYIRTED